jgi:DNA (cytosine-5)-methyltransferase 1
VRYLSVCSGIEAASVAWEPLGWEPVAFSEIERFPSAVLAHHWPQVPNLGDFTQIRKEHVSGVDLLVGGTPCQAFSVAGLRGGLDDHRGNLALGFIQLVGRLRPEWVVWENVPGVLSSGGGRDFGAFLGALAELGYGFAYRVLDAQYFGLAQRRRRVFVVACAGGSWQRAAAVLFERESLSGHPAPSREEGPRAPTGTVGGVAFSCRAEGFDASEDGTGRQPALIPVASRTLLGHGPRGDLETETFIPIDLAQITHGENRANPQPGDPASCMAGGSRMAVAFNARQDPIHGAVSMPLDTDGHTVGVAQAFNYALGGDPSNSMPLWDVSPTLGPGSPAVTRPGYRVRRLMPVEWERLQGFPDGHTRIPWRGKAASRCPDGPRYKAIGNSMAVPVMRWIGERIEEVCGV